jgi:predicted nucleic acid-binding protein
MAETIYLDTCALNRLTDDQSQVRVREEAEAVSTILDWVTEGYLRWFDSIALHAELAANPDPVSRSIVMAFLSLSSDSILQTPQVDARARAFQQQGFGQFDAVHVALAESKGIDWLFTVDDRFIRKSASQQLHASKPSVVNPLEWTRRRSLWLVKP